MRNQMQLKHQLFLHSKAWLMAAILSMIVLSVYNLVVSWLLQKIIDIAAGNEPHYYAGGGTEQINIFLCISSGILNVFDFAVIYLKPFLNFSFCPKAFYNRET